MLSNSFVVLDPDARYFFVHVPKTGGTSLYSWLGSIYGRGNCCEHIEQLVLPQPTKEVVETLKRFRVISGHVPIGWWSYFADAGFQPITIIRNPVDQFYSNVNHLLSQQPDALEAGGMLHAIRSKLEVSVAHFLENAEPPELDFFESPQSKPIFGAFPWRTCSVADRIAWLTQTYSAVLITETMSAELGSRVDRHAEEGKKFPRENMNRYKREELTEQQKSILRPLLEHDIALYKTVFELSLEI